MNAVQSYEHREARRRSSARARACLAGRATRGLFACAFGAALVCCDEPPRRQADGAVHDAASDAPVARGEGDRGPRDASTPAGDAVRDAIPADSALAADTGGDAALTGCAGVGAGKLSWSPATAGVGDYASYPKVAIVAGQRSYNGNGGDLWLQLPPAQRWEAPSSGGLVISNSRNVVLIGGEVYMPATIPEQETPRRSIYLAGITGTVFIEGLWIHGPGCGDIFTINSPKAKIYLQRIRAEITMRSEQALPVHADIVQPWGGHGGLFVDRLTGLSSYQGLQLQQDLAPVGAVRLRHVNLRHHPEGSSSANYLLWLDNEMEPIFVDGDTVWIEPAPDRPTPKLAHSLWPAGWVVQTDARGTFATHPTLKNGAGALVVQDGSGGKPGRIREGRPEGCDYVAPSAVGLGYISPGYAPP